MSAVHIDLIIGNNNSLHNENKAETMGGQESLSHLVEGCVTHVLEIPESLPECLSEGGIECVKKGKEGVSTQR